MPGTSVCVISSEPPVYYTPLPYSTGGASSEIQHIVVKYRGRQLRDPYKALRQQYQRMRYKSRRVGGGWRV